MISIEHSSIAIASEINFSEFSKVLHHNELKIPDFFLRCLIFILLVPPKRAAPLHSISIIRWFECVCEYFPLTNQKLCNIAKDLFHCNENERYSLTNECVFNISSSNSVGGWIFRFVSFFFLVWVFMCVCLYAIFQFSRHSFRLVSLHFLSLSLPPSRAYNLFALQISFFYKIIMVQQTATE